MPFGIDRNVRFHSNSLPHAKRRHKLAFGQVTASV